MRRAEERRDVEGGKRGWLCKTVVDSSFFLLSVSKYSPMDIHLPGATHERCHS